jgi:hypothetical protein
MSTRLLHSIVGVALLCGVSSLRAQVYSPKVLTPNQVDTTTLKTLARDVYRNAHAVTPREKAEAIWRFYLTDGRFVKPGIFYHIPGWAYEEPLGEVLDPLKLVNSYGFGLCYQDAPLLQATWDAGGFEHTRVWFLTGHTVAEVFYDGQYHYYDSDMMGYTTVGDGPFRTSHVASVKELELDRSILLSKLTSPKLVKTGAVDSPWYNADVRAGAIGDLADLFSSADDNYVYAYTRYPQGHGMDFVLRPGERIVRYYNQADPSLRYLPYTTADQHSQEFAKDYDSSLLVKNGPKSEKDSRRWSTGLIEYHPPIRSSSDKLPETQVVYSMPSPYVIFDASFSMSASLPDAAQTLSVETSINSGHSWALASTLQGPFSGVWVTKPAVVDQSAHGTLNAVAGTYGYLVRLTLHGAGADFSHSIKDTLLTTSFEFNPRTLPVIVPGTNVLNYESASVIRTELPIHADDATTFASSAENIKFISDKGQGYLVNTPGTYGQMIFALSPTTAGELSGFDAGGRFLDLRNGLAPDKMTAELRHVVPWPTEANAPQTASIAWSTKPNGPWITLWNYNPRIQWPDGNLVSQTLRWPEVDRNVRNLGTGSTKVYVRYRFRNLAMDAVRLATLQPTLARQSPLSITHKWTQDGKPAEHTEIIHGDMKKSYRFDLPLNSNIQNQELILAAQE